MKRKWENEKTSFLLLVLDLITPLCIPSGSSTEVEIVFHLSLVFPCYNSIEIQAFDGIMKFAPVVGLTGPLFLSIRK